MLKKRVNRYVGRVIHYLPLLDRKKARKIITGSIYARLDDLTEGMRPTASDLKMVLREMGKPEDLAEAYYHDFHRSIWKKIDIRKILHGMITLLTIVAILLVALGLVELVMGVGTMHRFVVGLALSVIVVLYQMMIQSRKTIAAD